jgi:hypothetical protein
VQCSTVRACVRAPRNHHFVLFCQNKTQLAYLKLLASTKCQDCWVNTGLTGSFLRELIGNTKVEHKIQSPYILPAEVVGRRSEKRRARMMDPRADTYREPRRVIHFPPFLNHKRTNKHHTISPQYYLLYCRHYVGSEEMMKLL